MRGKDGADGETVLRCVHQEQMRVILEAGSWEGEEGGRVAGRVRRRYNQLCQVPTTQLSMPAISTPN